MAAQAIERRQNRRVDLEGVQVEFRRVEGGSASAPILGQAEDVSLSGVLVRVPAPCPLSAGEAILCSVSVPPGSTKDFPFARMLWRGWVVRIFPEKRSGASSSVGSSEVRVAIAFSADASALGTVGTVQSY